MRQEHGVLVSTGLNNKVHLLQKATPSRLGGVAVSSNSQKLRGWGRRRGGGEQKEEEEEYVSNEITR